MSVEVAENFVNEPGTNATDDTATSGTMHVVSVTIAGQDGTVKVKVAPGKTVQDALLGALAATSGVDVSKLSAVVNGEDATLDQQVQDGDRVSAAPNVNNG